MSYPEKMNLRMNVKLLLLAGIVIAQVHAAPIVQFQATDLAGNLFAYSYTVSGYAFQQNQELAISFDPALYGTLSNGAAGSGFDVLLFQPNNPPGTSGIYSALAQVNNPSLATPFSVDFIFKGSGAPGAQPFSINQYDQNGNFVSTVASGLTTPIGTTVPEPGGRSLGGVAFLLGSVWWIGQRRRGSPVQA